MIVIAGVLIGTLWGGMLAKKRGGNGKDVAQYAISFAIALGLAGLIITLLIDRAM
jgi:uncharacterized protein YcfJ